MRNTEIQGQPLGRGNSGYKDQRWKYLWYIQGKQGQQGWNGVRGKAEGNTSKRSDWSRSQGTFVVPGKDFVFYSKKGSQWKVLSLVTGIRL